LKSMDAELWMERLMDV